VATGGFVITKGLVVTGGDHAALLDRDSNDVGSVLPEGGESANWEAGVICHLSFVLCSLFFVGGGAGWGLETASVEGDEAAKEGYGA
jgi:hypothetical protein